MRAPATSSIDADDQAEHDGRVEVGLEDHEAAEQSADDENRAPRPPVRERRRRGG